MKLLPLILITLLSTFIYAQAPKGIYYAEVLEIQDAKGYKYLKVDENGTQKWVAIANAPVAVGDKVGYDKKTIMHNFKSKTLNKTFTEIIFASDVYLPQKAQQPKSMKEMLGFNTKNPHANNPHKDFGTGISPTQEKKPAKPFVKKDLYTVEEVHMWREDLKDQLISVEGTISKVSHNIMKRDWVHLGDGTGDLVFTAASTKIKAGDKVLAKGKVIINKDFGYGYFYKVLIQDATFEVK